jgi:hypothetical protein
MCFELVLEVSVSKGAVRMGSREMFLKDFWLPRCTHLYPKSNL